MPRWNETPEGASLNQAFAQLQYTYQVRLPQHQSSLQNLANRPITG